MARRMLDYYELLFAKYELPVRQFVTYVGKGRPNMPTEVAHHNLQFWHSLINRLVAVEGFERGESPPPQQV
jgi:hypothetical protein